MRCRTRSTLALTPAPEGTLRGAIVAVDTDNELMSERFGNNTTSRDELDLRSVRDDERDVPARCQRDAAAGHDVPAHHDRSVRAEQYAGRRRRPQRFGRTGKATTRTCRAVSRCCFPASPTTATRRRGSRGSTRTARRSRKAAATASIRSSPIRRSTSALRRVIVGHELGHNFGASHTHCTNITNGSAPTGTNTIDQCYNAGKRVLQRRGSCPTAGPGAPLGTIMSYCNSAAPYGADAGRTFCSSIRPRSTR